jgi:hypothetical protein
MSESIVYEFFRWVVYSLGGKIAKFEDNFECRIKVSNYMMKHKHRADFFLFTFQH